MSLIEKQEIIENLTSYIKEKGQNDATWYVGLCEEAYGLTLNIIKRTSKFWMYFETGSPETALEIYNYCTKNLRLIGYDSIKTSNTNHKVIYIHKKNNHKKHPNNK